MATHSALPPPHSPLCSTSTSTSTSIAPPPDLAALQIVAKLLRECTSVLSTAASQRRSFSCELNCAIQRPPDSSQRWSFPNSPPDRLDAVLGIENQRSSFLGDRIGNDIPDRLILLNSSILEVPSFEPSNDCREVNLKPANSADAVGRRFFGRKGKFLPDRRINWQTQMGRLEGARQPGRGTARGWEVIKAGMEKVLGRSILPSRGTKLSYATPVDTASSTDRRVSNSTSSSTEWEASRRSRMPSALVDSPSTREAALQSANVPLEECTQGPQQSFLSRRMGDQALAGALAGTCVSLCLHPVDTVKTVIQAQSFGQRSVIHNLFAIISDRGISGLYRGLGSNLASSAPISAIYTFTYESVKASLLPHLPKEYHALAHCTAGGCASIATSFIFTPSECVKQRMQVGSLYRNSWLAFLGILRNGGLPVLYSGWGAVLCRNVPQSVIKFYTYEGLKHYALTGHPVGTPLSTWQTLAFGGLAGSTAALFTTPFDVIKTRLQTQVPGSIMYQKGVLQAFRHIASSEGLGALYRGLIPRLVIYVSQGALFFTSYEFFKQVLAVEVKKLSFHRVQSCSQPTVGPPNVAGST